MQKSIKFIAIALTIAMLMLCCSCKKTSDAMTSSDESQIGSSSEISGSDDSSSNGSDAESNASSDASDSKNSSSTSGSSSNVATGGSSSRPGSSSTGSASSKPTVNASVKRVSAVGMLTGNDSPNKTGQNWALAGCDLGIPIYDYNAHTMYFAFGDSYSTLDMTAGWRSNVIGVTSDLNASNNINFNYFINDGTSFAKEIFAGQKSDNYEVTAIPTGGIVIKGTIYIFYMSVRHWGVPGEWTINYNGVLKSTDHGKSWSRVNSLVWAGFTDGTVQSLTRIPTTELKSRYAPNFLQIFPVDGKDGYVYIYGIPGGRSGGVKLGRVAAGNIEKFSEYEYYTGTNNSGNPIFVKGESGLKAIQNSDASYIISPRAGEISVMYNSYLGQWMTMYQLGSQIVMRTSVTPWGKWSNPITVVTAAQYPGNYCSFIHEIYTENNGKTVYFNMSQWLPIYNVRLMKLELN